MKKSTTLNKSINRQPINENVFKEFIDEFKNDFKSIGAEFKKDLKEMFDETKETGKQIQKDAQDIINDAMIKLDKLKTEYQDEFKNIEK